MSIQSCDSIVLPMLEFDRISHRDIVQQAYRSKYSLFCNRLPTKTQRRTFRSFEILSKRTDLFVDMNKNGDIFIFFIDGCSVICSIELDLLTETRSSMKRSLGNVYDGNVNIRIE